MCQTGKTPVNGYGLNEGRLLWENLYRIVLYCLGCVKWLRFESLVVTLCDNLALLIFILGVYSPVVFQNSNLKRRPLNIAFDSSDMFCTTRVQYVLKTHPSADLLLYLFTSQFI
jgi:hypothetical protein